MVSKAVINVRRLLCKASYFFSYSNRNSILLNAALQFLCFGVIKSRRISWSEHVAGMTCYNILIWSWYSKPPKREDNLGMWGVIGRIIVRSS